MKYIKREHRNSPDFSLLTTKGNQNLTKQQHEIIIKWLFLFFFNFVWAVEYDNGHSYIWLMWGVILIYFSFFFNLLHKCVIYNSWKWIYT
jgi:glucan phosphoethanolaminetransferase (alkaline phosphatase superfamily)